MNSKIITAVLLVILLCSACDKKGPDREPDKFINAPFCFEIHKNISDDYDSIGTVLDNELICPLGKENISDPAFCFIRHIEYEGLSVHVFSFDVIGAGTAEYIVHGDNIELKNGLSLLSTRNDVVKLLGRPFKKEGEDWVWKSNDQGNYLVFSFSGDRIEKIRWHESRDPVYKDIHVWETGH